MNLRKSGYEIEVKGEDVSRLEEKMLESGLCNFVVPMWISREGDKVKINYECSGLTSMRELHLKRPKETFEIIEKALLSLNHSRDFYIPPEKLKLSMDTIYYNRQNRSVKIAYVPERNHSIAGSINGLIDEVKLTVNEETKEYLNLIKEDIEAEKRNLRQIAGYISEYRRSINQCTPGGTEIKTVTDE